MLDTNPDPLTAAMRDMSPALQQAHAILASADDVEGVKQAAARIRALTHQLVDETAGFEPATRIISEVNDMLTRRVIEVLAADAVPAGSSWCWIALGSEGRQEQTLSSDQDNGIIFDDASESGRGRFLGMAQRINGVLDACGFPLCKGNVMAGNPEWCLSLSEWKERFREWIFEGDPQALLNATIFFDLRPLYGAGALAEELGNWLALEASGNQRFLYQMAANALQREVPLGLIRRFAVNRRGKYKGTIDLKTKAAALFVDGGRIYGLASGTHAVNTADRFRLAVKANRLHPSDAERWINGFHFIQSLRLKNQQACYRRGEEMHNHVAPSVLDASDRARLLDALRQARHLHHRLVLDYPGIG
jgi:CBS domain-containing protein